MISDRLLAATLVDASAKIALKELLFNPGNNMGEWLSEYSLQGEEEEHRHDCTCRQCYDP